MLTDKGHEFCDVLLAIATWGDRWTAGDEGPPAVHRERTCGHLTRIDPRCARCGEPLHAVDVEVEAGPARLYSRPRER